MSETTTLPLLQEVEELRTIVSSAPKALEVNTNTVAKGEELGQALLARIAAEGMSPELDKEANNLLVRFREGSDKMKARREPVTKLFDKVRSVFTALEKKMDVTTAGTIPQQLQQQRDDYARRLKEVQQHKEQENAKKQAKETERISLAAEFETRTNLAFSEYLTTKKTELLYLFNGATLDNFEQNKLAISKFDFIYPFSAFTGIQYKGISAFRYHTRQEVEAIRDSVRSQNTFISFQQQFREAIEKYKQELYDKLPGKKSELEAIATADAKNKKLLEQQQQQREAEEKLRLEEEAKKQQETATQQVETKKQTETTQLLFETSAVDQVVEAPAAREGITITVTKSAGWLPIINLWFQKEGLAKDPDKLAAVKLESMKSWCEKYLLKNPDIKLESPYLQFADKLKTIARKRGEEEKKP